jgi:hypothetical protein
LLVWIATISCSCLQGSICEHHVEFVIAVDEDGFHWGLAPRDLSAAIHLSFARLAHLGKAPLEQIQLSLGHASVVTTELYLGIKQNLHDAPWDRLGLAPAFDRSNDA